MGRLIVHGGGDHTRQEPPLTTMKRSRNRTMRDPIHPGETLCEDLGAPGMSAAELARRIEVPVNASPRF